MSKENLFGAVNCESSVFAESWVFSIGSGGMMLTVQGTIEDA